MDLTEPFLDGHLSIHHRRGDFHEVMPSSLLFGPDCAPEFLQSTVEDGFDLLPRDRRIKRTELP
jgi:hypothetical protein